MDFDDKRKLNTRYVKKQRKNHPHLLFATGSPSVDGSIYQKMMDDSTYQRAAKRALERARKLKAQERTKISRRR